jgi:hypothetical protein
MASLSEQHFWAVYRVPETRKSELTGRRVARYGGRADPADSLGNLLELWSRDLVLSDWSDRKRFAAICYRKSTLTAREAAGMAGLSVAELRDTSVPQGPPWVLESPRTAGTIRIVYEGYRADRAERTSRR